MRDLTIPKTFLELAKRSNIPTEIALDFYHRTTAKVGWREDIPYRLVKAGVFEREGQAIACLTELRKNFRRSIAEGYVIENKEAVELHDDGKALVMQGKDYVQEARENFERLIGPLKKVTYSKLHTERDRKIAASDFHFPFADEKAFAALLQDPAEEIYIVGDWFDMYAASKHRKVYDHITVKEEFAIARAAMEELSKNFQTVKIIKGNHDSFSQKRVQEHLPQILPLIVHPVDLVAANLPNVEVIETVIPGTKGLTRFAENITVEFMALQNDILLAHFTEFCGRDATLKVSEWLKDWDHVLEFPQKPRIIVQGHSHKLALEVTPSGRLLVSSGCMCKTMQYQIEGHSKFSPGTLGYVAFYQNENGYTDISRTQLIPL